MDKIEKEELTMTAVPKAVNYLIEEIAEMRAVLLHIESQLGLGVDKHRPIKQERAAEILGITDRALNKLVRANEIPYYKRNKEIYFFEDELVRWVEDARIAPYYEQIRKSNGRFR